jgi:hypothetical protein
MNVRFAGRSAKDRPSTDQPMKPMFSELMPDFFVVVALLVFTALVAVIWAAVVHLLVFG